jgi:hypothetical protein
LFAPGLFSFCFILRIGQLIEVLVIVLVLIEVKRFGEDVFVDLFGLSEPFLLDDVHGGDKDDGFAQDLVIYLFPVFAFQLVDIGLKEDILIAVDLREVLTEYLQRKAVVDGFGTIVQFFEVLTDIVQDRLIPGGWVAAYPQGPESHEDTSTEDEEDDR